MAEYPALPLFTDAYLSDTRHLTTVQHGAYLLLLMTAWRMPDCALQNDDVFLARICCMDKRTWLANKATILSFWKLNDEQKWYQARLKDERKYVEHKRNKNVAAGKVSALKRKERHSTGVPTERQQKPNQPTPTPTKDISKDISKKLTKKKNCYSSEFEEIWQAYPRHDCSKSSANAEYETAIKSGVNHETIKRGIEAYANHCRIIGTEQRFIAHASTWLHECRWEANYSTGTQSEISPPATSKYIAEGERLAAKYKAEAEYTDRQGMAGAGIKSVDGVAQGVRQDLFGIGNDG